MRPPVSTNERAGAYQIPSHQLALMWRRVAAKQSTTNKETN